MSFTERGVSHGKVHVLTDQINVRKSRISIPVSFRQVQVSVSSLQ